MREISEDEADRLAGAVKPALLAKREHDATESAVALKRLPDCYLLGVSCDTTGRFQLFAIDDEGEAMRAYELHARRMDETGSPFLD